MGFLFMYMVYSYIAKYGVNLYVLTRHEIKLIDFDFEIDLDLCAKCLRARKSDICQNLWQNISWTFVIALRSSKITTLSQKTLIL